MAISYLCHDCVILLCLNGFDATNEVGRKYCEGCGNNEDNLVVVDADICDVAISMTNKKSEKEKEIMKINVPKRQKGV